MAGLLADSDSEADDICAPGTVLAAFGYAGRRGQAVQGPLWQR
jgi:hypothetical protein